MFQAPPKFPIESRAIYREPFKLGAPNIYPIRTRISLAELMQRMDVLPSDFAVRGTIMINGNLVPRDLWSRVYPKPNHAVVTFHLPLQGGGRSGGGGGGGGKQVLAIVAALAITVLSAGIATFGIPALGIAGGTLTSTLIAAGVSLAGSLLVNALITPPTRRGDTADSAADNAGGSRLEPASVSGNMLEQNAPFPRVVGTRRIFPPFVFEPTTEFDGQNEIVHALCALAGPHEIDDIRLGDTSIDELASDSDVTIQTFDGFQDSPAISYPERYSRTFPVQVEMSVHATDPENLALFAPPAPVWHGTHCADDPDEIWLHFVLQGLLRQEALTDVVSVPLRIRMRLRGGTDWRYLPELHISDCTQSQKRLQVKIFFGQTFIATPPTPQTDQGWTSARKVVPPQSVAPVGSYWNADPYFSDGSGNDVYEAATAASNNVINCTLTPDLAAFYLDHAEWPRGIYDIEVIRGAAFSKAAFTSSTYTYSGSILDFFGYRNTLTLPITRDGLLDRINLLRSVSIKNRPPLNEKNLSLIYIRARNRSVGNLSCRASGYVRDYNKSKSAWIDWVTTSNPVPHYRDILTGSLNFDPLPEVMLDETGLIEWRDRCVGNDLTCDLVVESGTLQEVLRLVASCGYARPYHAEQWGVIQDYDRSLEAPVQIFTPRNSSGFSWSKAFPRLPAGLRVNYRDDDYEYAGKQLMVYRRGAETTDARTEQITYDGLVRRADIIRRAEYDLLQADLRAVIYSLTVPTEALVCRRGSLVGVNTDVLQRHYGYARIVEVLLDGAGDVIGAQLDSPVQIYNNADLISIPDMLAVTDLLDVGLVSGVAIRHADGGVNIHTLDSTVTTDETDMIAFDPPISTDQIRSGNLVAIGLLGQEYRRLLVNEIIPAANLTARLTLVDEAPQLWAS